MAIVQVNRDPFARQSTERQTVNHGECAECGQPARFQYRTASDGGRNGSWSRPFCGIGCYRMWQS